MNESLHQMKTTVQHGLHTARKKSRSFKKRHPRLSYYGGTALAICGFTLAFFLLIFAGYVTFSLGPYINVDASAYTMKLSSVVYYQDEKGDWKELQKIHGTENRTLVDFDDIPDHVWKALVAIEDERFFEHGGVDWKSTAAAIGNRLIGGETTRGGSTITQQVIKNLTDDNKTTIKRKVMEIFRANRFARNYSKEEILEMYLNLVYFGNGSYGISAAAEGYFGKDVKDLSVAEAASIIGITQYPYKYDPARGDWYREQNRTRQLTVLYKMYEQGYLTREEYEDAKDEKLVFRWDEGAKVTKKTSEAGNTKYDSYFVEQVFNDVLDDLVDEKGYSRSLARDLLYTGGYKIYSTVDPELQKQAEKVFADRSNLNYKSSSGQWLQSGMTVIDNRTGDVAAIVGRFGKRDGAFLWSYAVNPRACGSAIKPLSTYAPALDTGTIAASATVDDYPVRMLGGKAWPKNAYSGFYGLIPLSTALKHSSNTTAVRVVEKLGLSKSYQYLTEKFGLSTLDSVRDKNSAALALGGFTHGVTTRDMAAAYATFPNNGVYTEPRTYVKVCDSEGNVVLEKKSKSRVILKESTVYTINSLLTGVVDSGTGTEAKFSGMHIAGKTGTTDSNNDRYFVGYTPYYTAAVWIGYDTPTHISCSGNPAAQLWKKVMKEAHSNLPDCNFSARNDGMTAVTVCTKTGLLAGSGCPTQTVYVAKGSAPSMTCDGHTHVEICSLNDKLAGDLCPDDQVSSVSAINFRAGNVSKYWGGYKRSLFGSEEGGFILADDSMHVLSDLEQMGVCNHNGAAEPDGDTESPTTSETPDDKPETEAKAKTDAKPEPKADTKPKN